jgi:pimeloyl-ACP methyl ester carboxylesterase
MTTVQQVTSHHWRVPAEPFSLTTKDGVRIEGTRLGEAAVDRPAIVLAHGLIGWHRKPRFAVFAEHLTPWFGVYAFDARGHGASGGVSDFGGAEIHDVDAVVRLARQAGHDRVVTVGTSMGAIAVIRHAALIGGADLVVSISSLASWDWHAGADPKARREFHARVNTVPGRAALRAWGVRLPERWDEPEAPEDVIGSIAPVPVVIVHGEDDRLFSVEHAHRLYEAAGDPKHLMVGDRFGHAEDGLTPAFARRLAAVIHDGAGLSWSG